jgi:hypothetical protein
MAILTATAGLAHEFTFLFHCLADRFTIGNTRLADIGIDFELTLEPIYDDFQVQLAHTRDDGLA